VEQPLAPDGMPFLLLQLVDPAMDNLVLVLLLLHAVGLSIECGDGHS